MKIKKNISIRLTLLIVIIIGIFCHLTSDKIQTPKDDLKSIIHNSEKVFD